jgi:myo-inositol-1(or 4)-monophosphatase
MAFRSALINVMTGAARKAARALVHDFGEIEQLQVSKKGPADFVYAANKRSEQILIKELMFARPRYGTLSKELGAIEGADSSNRWIVNPLDGTLNFLHGIPHFCLTIALERDGEIFAGMTYDPLRDELFWAEKGAGAHLNHSRLRVSSRDRLENALVATGLPSPQHQSYVKLSKELDALTPLTAGVLRLGSTALDLAYVASGRFDGFWKRGLYPWDVAAGIILIREAGGFVGEVGGGSDFLSSGSILGANDKLYDRIAKTLENTANTAE